MAGSPSAELARCLTCGGHGMLVDQRRQTRTCPTCQGAGLATWWAGRWWSWSHPINALTIAERRQEHVIKLLITGLLMLLVIGGAVLGGPVLYRALLDGQLLLTWLARDVSLAAWWLGIVAALYLYYRLERETMFYPRIPPGTDQLPVDQAWTAGTRHLDVGSRFSEAALRIMDQAWFLAQQRRRSEMTPAHVLHVLTTTPQVASMIVRMGLRPDTMRERLATFDSHQPSGSIDPVPSLATRTLLIHAFRRAAGDRLDRVTPPYLMAAISELEDPARELLYELGVDEQRLEHVIAWLLIQEDLRTRLRRYRQRAAMKPRGVIDRGYTASATPVLDRFSLDLTRRAREGVLPYVIGRDEELKKIFRIMASGRRSVMLVGDVGVGKTTVLNALAERMVAEDVPTILQDKRLVSLSSAALVAGAGGMGELEERVALIIQELVRAGNIVLAIEDFDQLVGVSSSGGGLDAAHMIAEELQRGTFLSAATAQVSAYRRLIEPSGVSGAFELVEVPEMDEEQSIVAVESRIGALEAKHEVYFTYDAIDRAVRLSQRYLHEKTQPGKALEILAEAATLARRARGPRALVLGDDVATIISEQSKINVRSVTADEQSKLLHLEDEIHGRIVGQDEAVKAVSNALRRARAEIRDTKRPIASFLFLGPTGVGKTELAKTVAAVYFGSATSMVRLDMSEYQDIASIHRLLGAPPGYGGSSGGLLTEAVRHRPFSLVLLDELEKAHPDVLNLFLQVMDDGRLTDASGRTIDFTNVIIIATSNAGTQHIQNRLREGALMETIKQELINDILQQYFRPEFLNRFDAVVVFKPLSPIQIVKIVGLMINEIARHLQTKGITLKASPEAIAELAQTGYDPVFGARPLRRLVQERVDDAIAKFLLQGQLGRRDVAVLEPGGTLRVEKAKPVG
ncbi:MAG: AAA family ATPase [Candidatus Kerfeldbacteria bacterium]|nr:AAA family ATPase [Candidatus Kerfeldbacteria bacterium]